MKALIVALCLMPSTMVFADTCLKTSSKGSPRFESCFNSPGLKWALDTPTSMSPEKMRMGPKTSPALTSEELESGVIFCHYFHHEFSSPGSAKFKCARTNAEGVFFDEKGELVPTAKGVSTDAMRLQVQIGGEVKSLGEGYLLDEKNAPLLRTTSKGKVEPIEADHFKVKYFVDIENSSAMQRKQNVEISIGQTQIPLNNVFVGPTDITTPRWNEVFTEVASTRLLWALGYPADVMIPAKKVVCRGCEPHAKDQKKFNPKGISIYNFPVIERKMPGSKIGDFFNMNEVIAKNLPRWSAATQNEFEGLALTSQLIAYHNFINLQNRLQCEAGKLDKTTGECSSPMPLMQDVGSTWAGRVSAKEMKALGFKDNPRGNLYLYQKGKVFADPRSCELFYHITSNSSSETKAGPGLQRVSREGVEAFKARLRGLTPEVLQSLFEVSRYGDMEPTIRDAAPGANLEEKRQTVINGWVRSLQNRIQEIENSNCPSRGPSAWMKETTGSSSRQPASEISLKKKDLKIRFKSLSTEERDHLIRIARVTSHDYNPETVAEFDILGDLKENCGERFDYSRDFQWPTLDCRYRPDNGSLGGYSLKFNCEFQAPEKANGIDQKKVKYAISESTLNQSEVLESIAAPILTKLIGFHAETFCPVSIRCLDCPSGNPWKNQRAAATPRAGNIVAFPWAVVEEEIPSITMARSNSRPRSEGLDWTELNKVEAGSREQRIEREAWLLWMHFLQATDAHYSNNRLSCLKISKTDDGTPTCVEPVLYTHDYGHSFYQRFQFQQWKNIPALVSGTNGKGCFGSMGHPALPGMIGGLIVKPQISAEARDLLVQRLERITDEQLLIIHQLAKLDSVKGISLPAWKETFRRKISEMKSANCQALDSGASPKTALSIR